MVADGCRRGNLRAARQLSPARILKIGHLIKIMRAELAYPALQLFSTKQLLTQLAAIRDQLCRIKFKQIP